MSDIFFTSDLHLAHVNVLGHDNQPFDNIQEHDDAILEAYAHLPRGSELWVLGDVAFSMASLERFFAATSHLQVCLVRGNHDDKIAWKHRARFKGAYEATYIKRSCHGEDVKLYLSHYAHRTWRNSCHGSYHLFGHSHGALPNYGRSMDVGVNVNDYKPVCLEDIVMKLSSAEPVNHHTN